MSKGQVEQLFSGRKLIIATKHKKEKVIAPVFNKVLKVKCVNEPSIDTDCLGTFTGEIERVGGVLETLRRKCLMALEIGNYELALASEGSFGPHPSIGFLNTDDEMLMFMDAKNGFEIVVREISMNTNYNGTDIASEEELLAFAEKIGFPSHGLIMRPSNNDYSGMIKGITELEALKDSFQNFKSKFGAAYIETDMRALYNPTRMEVIRVAAQKLADKIVSFCPTCYTPGFGVTLVKSGLPCSNCGFPTRSTLCHERQCAKCHYTDEIKFPHGKFTEEPTFCDFCNP